MKSIFDLSEPAQHEAEQRFANSLAPTEDGHIGWKGPIQQGYPRLCYGRLDVPARRAAWEFHEGERLPDGKRIYGTCEHKWCLHPEHLVAQTPKEWNEAEADRQYVAMAQEGE